MPRKIKRLNRDGQLRTIIPPLPPPGTVRHFDIRFQYRPTVEIITGFFFFFLRFSRAPILRSSGLLAVSFGSSKVFTLASFFIRLVNAYESLVQSPTVVFPTTFLVPFFYSSADRERFWPVMVQKIPAHVNVPTNCHYFTHYNYRTDVKTFFFFSSYWIGGRGNI